jgi:hypothetical protein
MVIEDFAPIADAGSMVVEDFAPQDFAPIEEFTPAPSAVTAPSVESFAAPKQGPDAKLFGAARLQLGVDTSFDSTNLDPLPENVFDLKGRLNLGADVKVTDSLRVVAEARARWRGVARQGLTRTKAQFEASVGEAFVDWYSSAVDLRLGNQVFAFGANPALAPTDALNPSDLRESALLGEPEDMKVPVFGIRALGQVGRLSWTVAYVPFFQPNRYTVFGQDEALLQPGLGLTEMVQVDESIEDEIQPHLLETERPKAFPYLGDLGLRFGGEVGGVKLGASWVWINEKLPQVTMDPELTALIAARTQGVPVPPAVEVSVMNRLAAGERLWTGRYDRQHLFGIEGSTLLGPVQLDVDAAYSPRTTFVNSRLEPTSKATATWVLGVAQAEDSPVVFAVTYMGMAIFDIKATELLVVLEPTTAIGANRTGWLHLVLGNIGYKFWGDRLELSLRGAFEPIQKSFSLAPRFAYLPSDRLTVWLGAELYEGPALSPLGYFGRNDQVLVGVRYAAF